MPVDQQFALQWVQDYVQSLVPLAATVTKFEARLLYLVVIRPESLYGFVQLVPAFIDNIHL